MSNIADLQDQLHAQVKQLPRAFTENGDCLEFLLLASLRSIFQWGIYQMLKGRDIHFRGQDSHGPVANACKCIRYQNRYSSLALVLGQRIWRQKAQAHAENSCWQTLPRVNPWTCLRARRRGSTPDTEDCARNSSCGPFGLISPEFFEKFSREPR
jgi:hypothetical protein